MNPDNPENYLKAMKKIYQKIIDLIEEESEDAYIEFDKIYEYLDKHIKDKNNQNKEDINRLYELMYILVRIGNNHYRTPTFFKRIEGIIIFFKKKIQENFTNEEIFHIFCSNKRLLLFIINSQIITIDDQIATLIKNYKSKRFFYNEYFFNTEMARTDPEEFERLRLIGENENYMCQLIRSDSVEEFISYVNKNNYPIRTGYIKPTLFETNPFLLKNQPRLIEYAAFYGSIQIFKFLFMNQATTSPDFWNYVIHGKNPLIIHFIEENNIFPKNKNYEYVFKESMKCHHNDIANYIQDTYMSNNSSKFDDIYRAPLHYSNYNYFPNNLINNLTLFYACKYDLVCLLNLITKTKELDPFMKIVFLFNLLMMFLIFFLF